MPTGHVPLTAMKALMREGYEKLEARCLEPGTAIGHRFFAHLHSRFQR